MSRIKRWAALAAVLVAVGVVVPDSQVAVAQAELVKYQHAEGVALEKDMIWILAVGSDARVGEDMTRVRGDALQLVGMNTRTGAATAIGIPRDSYVPIPGHGNDRINAALYYGGPQLLGEAVGDLVGVEPDYIFVTRFEFLHAMINEIGGITVNNPRSFSDPYLRPGGFEAGKIKLNGQGATAFSRVRKSLPGGDFDRSANQQLVLRGIQAKIAERVDRPGFIDRGVLSVLKHTSTDLGPAELFRIAHAIAQVDPRKITTCVVHGGFATVGGASVVSPDIGAARRYGDDARKDATIERC
ncbi:LCP family protein [Nocardioides sp. GXZ039]|uniref:LCP family protein n=1 Tax=Nocardioides sp. GXZ039 TaxID=3136018 RepID=UPI0030F38BC9